MPSRMSPKFEAEGRPSSDAETGYASSGSSRASTPEIYFTTPHLTFLNRQLQNLEPQRKSTMLGTLGGAFADISAAQKSSNGL